MPRIETLTRHEVLDLMLARTKNQILEWEIEERFLQHELLSKQLAGTDKPLQMAIADFQGKMNAGRKKVAYLEEMIKEQPKILS